MMMKNSKGELFPFAENNNISETDAARILANIPALVDFAHNIVSQDEDAIISNDAKFTNKNLFILINFLHKINLL